MSEIKNRPVRIVVGETEYDAFSDEHSWNDIARWIKAHGPVDVEEFLRCFRQVSA